MSPPEADDFMCDTSRTTTPSNVLRALLTSAILLAFAPSAVSQESDPNDALKPEPLPSAEKGTFDWHLQQVDPPSGSTPFIEQYFEDCNALIRKEAYSTESTINEFDFKRCVDRVLEFRASTQKQTYCSQALYTVGSYNFHTHAFPLETSDILPSPWTKGTLIIDLLGFNNQATWRPTGSKTYTYIGKKEALKASDTHSRYIGVSTFSTTQTPLPIDEEGAEAIRKAGGKVLVQYIFSPGPTKYAAAIQKYAKDPEPEEIAKLVDQWNKSGLITNLNYGNELANTAYRTDEQLLGLIVEVTAMRVIALFDGEPRTLYSWPMKPDKALGLQPCPGSFIPNELDSRFK